METLNAASEALCCSHPARKSKRNPSKVSQGQLKEGCDTETRQPMLLGSPSTTTNAKKKKKEEAEITVDAPLYPIMTDLTVPASMLQYLIDDGKESGDQINRRDRNKDHAKRARLKKKSLFISLRPPYSSCGLRMKSSSLLFEKISQTVMLVYHH